MQWLTENWVWVVVFIVFVGMHLFGHGGHGGGCGGGHDRRPRPGKEDSNADKPSGHQH